LQHILVRRGYTVVDRADLDKIRSERDFQFSYEVDDNTAVGIGKFVGADLVVTGSISGTNTLRRLRLKVIDTQTTVIKGTASVAISSTSGTTAPPPPSPITPKVTSITVTPSTATVTKGQTRQFCSTVTGTNNPSQAVTWSVIGGNSTNTNISSNGLLSVARNDPSSTLTVRAVSTADATKSASASVTLLDIPPTVASVTISPSVTTVLRGNSQQFRATVQGEHNPAQTVVWTISGNTHSGTTISDDGFLSIASNETAKKVILKATSTVDPNKSKTLTINTTPPTPLGINVFGGAGLCYLVENTGEFGNVSDPNLGYIFGVSADIKMGKSIFKLEPGVNYNIKYMPDIVYDLQDISGRYSYLDIFAKAKLDIWAAKTLAIQPYLGYSTSFLISAENEYNGISHDIKDDCNSLVHGLHLGADFVISNAFMVGTNYDIGLTNIWKDGYTEVRINSLWLKMGWKW